MNHLPTLDRRRVLIGALQVIKVRGWVQDDFYDYAAFEAGTPIERCGVCLRAAVNIAAGHPPSGSATDIDVRPDVIDALALHLGWDPSQVTGDLYTDVPAATFVADWNDKLGRTVDEVEQAVRDCAAALTGPVLVPSGVS